jgi:hypothetical protein
LTAIVIADLVVRDVDRRRLEALVQLLDLGTHLRAKRRRVGRRLVERNTCGSRTIARPLATRCHGRRRVAADSGRDRVRGRDVGLLHALSDVCLRPLREHQRERHVSAHGRVRMGRMFWRPSRCLALSAERD